MSEEAPPFHCFNCRRAMKGSVFKLWGKFYYTCDNPDCPIKSVDIAMKDEKTPAGRFFAKSAAATSEQSAGAGD